MRKKIKIIAPCFYADFTTTQKKYAQKFLTDHGFSVSWGKNVFKKTVEISVSQFRATSKERLADLTKTFQQNPDVILAVRGGGAVAHLLPFLDWAKIKKSTSLFTGFSDTTAFQNAYYAKTHKPSITGMLAIYIKEKPQESITTSFFNLLNGGGIDFKGLPCYAKGKASGILIGGNLTSFTHLIGTPYMPRCEGKILVLEDIGEPPYKIDEMLTHLKNAGIFNKLNGVIVGDFYKCRNGYDKTDDHVYRVLKNFFKGFKIPVMYGLPYGHMPQHFCLPLGTKTTMDTSKKIIHIDGISKKR